MNNKKSVLVVAVAFIIAILCTCVLEFSLRRSKDYYIEKFKDNKNNFDYFSHLNDSVFIENIGCNEYVVLLTQKDLFSQNCNSFNNDSVAYFKMEFLSAIQRKRISSFMDDSNLEYIVFRKQMLSFVFHEKPNVIITYGDFKSEDGNYYDFNIFIHFDLGNGFNLWIPKSRKGI